MPAHWWLTALHNLAYRLSAHPKPHHQINQCVHRYTIIIVTHIVLPHSPIQSEKPRIVIDRKPIGCELKCVTK